MLDIPQLTPETAHLVATAKLTAIEEVVWRSSQAGIKPCCVATVMGMSEANAHCAMLRAEKKVRQSIEADDYWRDKCADA